MVLWLLVFTIYYNDIAESIRFAIRDVREGYRQSYIW